jgi:hypothetical protein
MSQVEFVAVFMTIFKRFRVAVALNEGESEEEGRRRAKQATVESFPKLTMQMERPGSVGLRFVRR